jgi:hypothetical protein
MYIYCRSQDFKKNNNNNNSNDDDDDDDEQQQQQQSSSPSSESSYTVPNIELCLNPNPPFIISIT